MDTNRRLSYMEKKIIIMLIFIRTAWNHQGTLIERITYAEERMLSHSLQLVPCVR
jgi:hypothetical protein